MNTLLTNIVDITDPLANNDVNKFNTTGLKLAVGWNHEVKEIVVISDQIPENLENTLIDIFKQKYSITVFPQFTARWDVTTATNIIDTYPDCHVDTGFINNIKNMNHGLSSKAICRVLSHALVWDYCVKAEHPVIIMEAGSVLTNALEVHIPRNSIINLSNSGLNNVNVNWNSFQGIDCYSVDQFVSRQLLNHLYNQGIRDSLTKMIRDDLFCICEI